MAHFCLLFRGILTKDPIQSELMLEKSEANSYGLIQWSDVRTGGEEIYAFAGSPDGFSWLS
jgi:hypothetical protein